MKKTKRDIQKKIEIKNELERISNKTVLIFTVSLVCEIVLLFLYTAFKGVGSHIPKLQSFVTVMSVIGFICFAALILSSCTLKKKQGNAIIVKKLKDWSIVSIVVSIASFFIYPVDIVTGLFTAIGFANKGGVIAMKLTKFMGPVAILAIIVGIVIYVIGMFIYYNIKSNKIKNSK